MRSSPPPPLGLFDGDEPERLRAFSFFDDETVLTAALVLDLDAFDFDLGLVDFDRDLAKNGERLLLLFRTFRRIDRSLLGERLGGLFGRRLLFEVAIVLRTGGGGGLAGVRDRYDLVDGAGNGGVRFLKRL